MTDVKIFEDAICEQFNVESVYPDMDYNGILIPQVDKNYEDVAIEDIVSFFEGLGVEVSYSDDCMDWNCTFENCDLTTVSFGNALLGDGSIKPSITLSFCKEPNKYWRGY